MPAGSGEKENFFIEIIYLQKALAGPAWSGVPHRRQRLTSFCADVVARTIAVARILISLFPPPPIWAADGNALKYDEKD
jgi:hypothetical protein